MSPVCSSSLLLHIHNPSTKRCSTKRLTSPGADVDDAHADTGDPNRISSMPDGESVMSWRTRNETCDPWFIAQISWYSHEVVGSPPSTYPLPPNRCGTQSRASRTFGPQQERSWTIAWSARAKRHAHPKRGSKGVGLALTAAVAATPPAAGGGLPSE